MENRPSTSDMAFAAPSCVRVAQSERPRRKRRFAFVAHAVGVHIVKGIAFERAQLHRADQRLRVVLLALTATPVIAFSVPWCASVLPPLTYPRHLGVLGQQVVQCVGGGHDAAEIVGSVRVDGLGQVDLAVVGQKPHLAVRKARFTRVHQPVVVFVVEKHAAQRGGLHESGVQAGQRFAHREEERLRFAVRTGLRELRVVSAFLLRPVLGEGVPVARRKRSVYSPGITPINV